MKKLGRPKKDKLRKRILALHKKKPKLTYAELAEQVEGVSSKQHVYYYLKQGDLNGG